MRPAGLADRAGRPLYQAAAERARPPPRARPAQAHTLGMVDAHGLHHCVLEAARDLRAARARYAFEPVDWPLLVRQLNADVGAANRFLPDNLQAPFACHPRARPALWPALGSQCMNRTVSSACPAGVHLWWLAAFVRAHPQPPSSCTAARLLCNLPATEQQSAALPNPNPTPR